MLTGVRPFLSSSVMSAPLISRRLTMLLGFQLVQLQIAICRADSPYLFTWLIINSGWANKKVRATSQPQKAAQIKGVAPELSLQLTSKQSKFYNRWFMLAGWLPCAAIWKALMPEWVYTWTSAPYRSNSCINFKSALKEAIKQAGAQSSVLSGLSIHWTSVYLNYFLQARCKSRSMRLSKALAS